MHLPSCGSRALALVTLLTGALPAVCVAADGELDRLAAHGIPSHDNSYQGMHSDFYTDPVGRFMDLLAAGAVKEARALEPEVCTAWKSRRTNSAMTGTFSVQGVELSLDRLCGLAPVSPKR